MTVKPNRPPLPRMAAWSAGLGVAGSILAVALLAWGMSDVDGDGEASFQEMGDGTLPMRGDSDGDGAADGWEKANGFDPMKGNAFDSLGAPPEDDPLCIAGLKECAEEDPEPAEEPQGPKVSDSTAQMRTGMMAFGAALLAAVAGLFTGRAVLRT